MAVVFLMTAAVIYSLGHVLQTLTAVPRSTHTSTLSGTVNEYLLSGCVIIINVDGNNLLTDSQTELFG